MLNRSLLYDRTKIQPAASSNVSSYNANNFHAVFETATINYDWSNTYVAVEGQDESGAAVAVRGELYDEGQSSSSGMYLDFGYDIGSLFGVKLVPWIRTSAFTNDDDDSSKETTQTMYGLTYWPTDNVSIKMDMGTSEKNGIKTDIFNIGLGYMF